MTRRDGSAGDADYGVIGHGYRNYRQPEPAFAAAMTTFSVHQWRDLEAGLAELRRVACGPVVIMTCDPDLLERFWLTDYAPEAISTEARRYPSIERIAVGLGGTVDVSRLPIPLNCVDGFSEAYFGRPEMLLDPGARQANSAWSFVSDEAVARFDTDLRRDLDDGTWDLRFGHLRNQPSFEGSLVLIVAKP
ncbi:SAM-dependent methyltransferase [Brevibacterium oceani]|uniref:SAM-dependent methyltransferase n=1 Tax=Brevibacterium oceani TaxID=358099 RepID=UPI001B344F42|nr:SAM-dependent methyltransferase [Brevibacterium oceani]